MTVIRKWLFLALGVALIGGGKSGDDSAAPLIDTLLERWWMENKVTPAPAADDAEFLRRVTLDLTGTVPAADEVAAFLSSKAPDKRRAMIDALMESPAFVDHWTTYWSNLLIGRVIQGEYRESKEVFNRWLADAIRANKPYNVFVTELLTATGRNDENGAAGYLLTLFAKGDRAPEFITGAVSRTFLGVRLQCAQCHNHPYEKWTQENFYGMTSFFSRATARPIREEPKMDANGKKIPQQPKYFELFDRRQGEAKIPTVNTVVPPTFIDGTKVSDPKKADRRTEFAAMLVSPKNPLFAKAIVNRIWATLMGKGIVDPSDDFRDTNPPSHPELLDALAKDFIDRNYDLKRLIRSIVNSRAYQLSSRASGGGDVDRRETFAQARLRAMTPEQLFDSLVQVTGAEDLIRKRAKGNYEQAKERILKRIAFLFENDEMEESADFEGTIPQALLMMNGQMTTEGSRTTAATRIKGILAATKDPGERIDAIVLTVLSRPATESERRRFVEFVKASKGADDAYQDIFWTLLNSTEFFYNH